MVDVIVGLGANLGDPPAVFVAALDRLSRETEVVGVSRLWRTRPIGPEQPDFTNAAALLEWPGGPLGLLRLCRDIEARAGRNRQAEDRWGPRVLDLDLLVVRDLVWRSRDLVLPHPRFHRRAFALVPAAEVAPDWIHPTTGRTIGELAVEVQAADPGALLSSAPFPIEL
ncbi:MAG: 2-amino-4-hydroxy-6-hydroxymethyldihydropteridine diphosphokinase [Candidatus Sulfomarinibacteraceae bacterium]